MKASIVMVMTLVGVALAAKNYVPTVLMHGLGDSGSHTGMKSLALTISSKYSGAYAISVDIADSLWSYVEGIERQTEEFAKAVQSDPKLANGFNVVGLAQGGLIVRAYVEKFNNPPVFKMISICGTQNGISKCPNSVPAFMCSHFESNPYSSALSFSAYWKDAMDQQKYLQENKFLPDLNNELSTKNEIYKKNMISLQKYVLVEALKDTIVYPKATETHGYYAWGNESSVVQMRDTEAYKEDWIGLQTLDKANKLDTLSFDGDHLQFTDKFWNTNILPYFDMTFDEL